MELTYKGHIIRSAVYNRPDGVAFSPRAVLILHRGPASDEKSFEWTDECKTKMEAEERSIELAKQAIDNDQGFL